MDIQANRKADKYTTGELAGRFFWACCTPLFRWSPRICWAWRRFVLRIFGARVGAHVHIHPTARIFLPWNLEIGDWSSVGFDALLYNLGPLRIGDRVTISQRAHLCGGTHKCRDESMPLVRASITIGDEAWICADAYVGPGVSVGPRAVVGARSVAVRDVPEAKVVIGNPARIAGSR